MSLSLYPKKNALSPVLYNRAKYNPVGIRCSCGVVHTRGFTKIDRDPCQTAIVIMCSKIMVQMDRARNLKSRLQKLRSLYLYANRILDARQLMRPYSDEWVRNSSFSRLILRFINTSHALEAKFEHALKRSDPSQRKDVAASMDRSRVTMSHFRERAKRWRAEDYLVEDGLTDLLGRDVASHVRQFI